MAIHKYMRGNEDGEWSSYYRKDMLTIGEDQGTPIYISKDGKIHAQGFVDVNDDFEFYVENDKFKVFAKDQREGFLAEYVFTKNDNKIYPSVSYDDLIQCFENIYFPLKVYDNQEPPETHKKYRLLNRKTKSQISSFTSSVDDPASFHFDFFEGTARHVEPRVEGAWFGPYNYDVYLDATYLAKNINDLIVVRSGENNQVPKSPTQYNVSHVVFSTGASGHVYVETPSIPNHNHATPISVTQRRFKFKSSGHDLLTQSPESSKVETKSGIVGVFKNGVFARASSSDDSYMGSGMWMANTVVAEGLDVCNGLKQSDQDLSDANGYHYLAAPTCLEGVLDNASHSPLLGYARDGFPIYGPYGYTEPLNPSSVIKKIDTSYRLKQATSREKGPNFSDFGSGYFLQDYEYVNALGDLDDHNGRLCVTPEYPNGTYAYFTTLDDNLNPAYPYIVGSSYYGRIEGGEGYQGSVTETPLYYRSYISDKNELKNTYPDPRLNVWDVYGDTNRNNIGLKSEKIIFVSPHIVMEATGVFLHTGKEQYTKIVSGQTQNATYNGNLRMATGNGDFLAKKSVFTYPTSKDCHLMEGNPFSGGMTFLYEDADTSTSLMSIHQKKVTDTYFYSHYKNHKRVKNKVHSGQWNGVIPAGTTFKVENWSFNGDWAGFEGRLSVRPWKPHPLTSGNVIVLNTVLTGHGDTYESAYANAMEKTRQEMKNKINTLLVNSGVKNPNAKMKSWQKMKEITV